MICLVFQSYQEDFQTSGMLPTKMIAWEVKDSEATKIRLEIPSRMEPWRVVFPKFRTWRVDIWLINSGNSPLILLSWISRCSRWLILVRFLGKLPVNLIFPKEKNFNFLVKFCWNFTWEFIRRNVYVPEEYIGAKIR